MNSENCIKCGKSVTEDEKFCPECGTKLTCKSCGTRYKKDSKFCGECGLPVEQNKPSTISGSLNTIKYRKSNDEVSCEISFTDQVGKDGMNDLLAAIVNNKGSASNILYDQPNTTTTRHLEIGGNHQPSNIISNDKSGDMSLINQDSSLDSQIPHLNDVESKIDCSENTWIGIHAFYLSEYGLNNFNREEVREAYMRRRKTESRVSNFAAEWKKAHNKYFRTINDNELNFKSGSISELKDTLTGSNTKNSSLKKATTSGGNKKTTSKSVDIEEFELTGDPSASKPSLEEFLTVQKLVDNTADRIVVIAYYITRLSNQASFSEGQIEFAYKALQLPERPGHLRQTINNVKNNKVWFKDVSQGRWTLERIGEIYVDQKLPNKQIQ